MMDRDRAVLRRAILIAAAVVIFFTGIVFSYYRMLYRETQANIIATGRENAVISADKINRYLSASADILTISGYRLDGMLRDGSTQEEILAYLTSETDAVRDSLIADTTGIYGYFKGTYLDGSGWQP
ncbi:MAG: hypothetical protein IK096_07760, partial [Lachnospiraceae bacterium]|nr:hypothetical protein [Lachnospiraceae bacterium]